MTILSVPYLTQRNNPSVGRNNWTNTCNASCHAMLLEFLKPGSLSEKSGGGEAMDSYYIRALLGTQNSTDHGVHTRILEQFGIKSEWRYDLGYEDIDDALEKGRPMPVGVLHRGHISAPAGGHIITVIGYDVRDGKEGYICHDPWGYGFAYQDSDGRAVFYPKSPSLDRRWLPDGPYRGWGRVILDS